MRDRQWNSERIIVFQKVILQRAQHVTKSHAIRRRIGKQLDSWEAGCHGMIMEETLHTCAQYLTVACREESEGNRAQTYHSQVLRGKLQTAVRWITEREMGGVLQHGERCTDTGERVMEVLCTNPPEACPPTAASLDSYPDRPPEIVSVDITDDMVTAVVGRLSGGEGPGGADSISLQHWRIRFGEASG